MIARKFKILHVIAVGTVNALYACVRRKTSMKTKLLALLFLVGTAAFAAPRVVVGVGVGVGVAPAYGYYAPPAPAAAYVAPAPVYWGPRAYYGPRWVAPHYYGPGYYGPRHYGRGYY